MSGVTIKGLHKHFVRPQVRNDGVARGAINGLDLEIREGEFFVLLGPSGCGKTTTLRCIAGLETPDTGSITISDRLVAEPASGVFVPANKRSIGMVFQSYALWPHMTVGENVAYPLKHRRKGLSRTQQATAVAEALELVKLGGLEHRGSSDLSGGQQQRVALARAIVAQPDLLLFDEPLSNLDAQLRLRLRADLRRVHEQSGRTSVFVTHDQSEALALADRVAVMHEGEIKQLGTPEDIFLRPASRFVAEFVGFDNLLDGAVVGSTADALHVLPDGWQAPLAAQASTTLRIGERVIIAFRSASLRLSGEVREGDNLRRATLRSVNYLGEYFQGEVALEGSPLVGRFLGYPHGLTGVRSETDAPVQVALDKVDIVALPAPVAARSEAA